MAERRMFSKVVLENDNFLNLSDKSKLLYVYMGLEADDDGFIGSVRKLISFIEADKSNLQELINNNYIFQFESGVCVIRHWNANNYLRHDRYHPTLFQNERKLITLNEKTREYEWYTSGIPKVYRDKNSIDKTSKDKEFDNSLQNSQSEQSSENTVLSFKDYYEGIEDAFDNPYSLTM